MEIAYLCGFAAAIIAFIVGRKLLRRTRTEKHFDEMQLQLRAAGYRLGFMTVLLCLVGFAFISDIFHLTIFSMGFAMMLIFMIGLVVFAVYCIIKEAFFSVGQNSLRFIAVVFLVILCNAIPAGLNIMDRSIFEDGQLTLTSGSNLIMVIGFAVILAALIIKTVNNNVLDEDA